MFRVLLEDTNITKYIDNEVSIRSSSESEISLLYYADKFDLVCEPDIINQLDNLQTIFRVYYNDTLITLGLVISVNNDIKEQEITLECGTIEYMYTQQNISMHKSSKKIYQFLEEWRDSCYWGSEMENYRALKLEINKESNLSDFGPYKSYNINEVVSKEDISNYFDFSDRISRDGEDGTINKKGTYTGFFYLGDNLQTINQESGDVSLEPKDKKQAYFGRIVLYGFVHLGVDYIQKIRGRVYKIEDDTIKLDYSSGKTIKTTLNHYDSYPKKEWVVTGSNNQIIWLESNYKIAKENPEEANPEVAIYEKTRWGQTNFEAFAESYDYYDNLSQIKKDYQNLIEMIEQEIKAQRFTEKELEDDKVNHNIKGYSIYQYEGVLFITVEIDKEFYLYALQPIEEDLFHYYYDESDSSKVLSDISLISDKTIFFRGDEIYITDREGFGTVKIRKEDIEKDRMDLTSLEFDKSKVDGLGTQGGYEVGIALIKGDVPPLSSSLPYSFSTPEQIKKYYLDLQRGQKETHDMTVYGRRIKEFPILGKKLQDNRGYIYGRIHSVEYRNNDMLTIKTKKRI